MNYQFLLAAILTLIILSKCNQERETNPCVVWQDPLFEYFSGPYPIIDNDKNVVFVRNDEGRKVRTLSVQGCNRHGEDTIFDPASGNPMLIRHWSNDKKDGFELKIYPGILDTATIGKYRDGKRIDTLLTFYKSGQIRTVAIYDTLGNENASVTSYYENGQVEEIGQIEKGRKAGTWKRFYDTGAFQGFFPMKNGMIHGEVELLRKDGSVLANLIYKMDSIIHQEFYHEKSDTTSFNFDFKFP